MTAMTEQDRKARAAENMRRRRAGQPPLESLRPPRPALRVPSDPLTLAYLAGLFDGEGCITRGSGVQWTLQIGMTDQPVMEWCHATLGGSLVKRSRQRHWKPIWVWRLRWQLDIRDLGTALLPYLRVKRGVVEDAIADIELRRVRPGSRMRV